MIAKGYIALFAVTAANAMLFDALVFTLLYTVSTLRALLSIFSHAIKEGSTRPTLFKIDLPLIEVKEVESLNVLRTVYNIFALVISSYLLTDGESRILFLLFTVIAMWSMPQITSSSAFQGVIKKAFWGVRFIFSLLATCIYYPVLALACLNKYVGRAVSKAVNLSKRNNKASKKAKKG